MIRLINLQINSKLFIPINEIKWRFSRSSGPGGQNVNKTESRVEIIFNIGKSRALNQFQKTILLDSLKNKIINNCISIKVQEKRTQFENRQLAIHKLKTLLKDKLMPRSKTRQATIPTKASKIRRVESKKKRGELKRSRHKTIEKEF